MKTLTQNFIEQAKAVLEGKGYRSLNLDGEKIYTSLKDTRSYYRIGQYYVYKGALDTSTPEHEEKLTYAEFLATFPKEMLTQSL